MTRLPERLSLTCLSLCVVVIFVTVASCSQVYVGYKCEPNRGAELQNIRRNPDYNTCTRTEHRGFTETKESVSILKRNKEIEVQGIYCKITGRSRFDLNDYLARIGFMEIKMMSNVQLCSSFVQSVTLYMK